MGKGSEYRPGTVVWATVTDRNGANPKTRPLLVIEPAARNNAAVLCCLAISTDPADDPSDPTENIPWDAVTGSSTGLYTFSRVVLLWFVQLEQRDIVERSGEITKSQLTRILVRRQQEMQFRR